MTERALAFKPLTEAERAASKTAPVPERGRCLMPAPIQPALPPHKLGKPSATWRYLNAEGALLGAVARFDPADGGKDILPLTCWDDGNGPKWRWRAFPEPRPLYGLDRLARRPDAPVLAVEGEKTAGAARAIFPGHVCITSPSGAGAAGKVGWSPLKNRAVTIWPDADEPGRTYAREAAGLIREAGGASVAIVAVPDTWPDGWDVADSPPDGVTHDDLLRMLADARPPAVASTGDDWPEPEPLPALPDVAPFDFDLLPNSLRPWIEDIAERVQCPPDFPAVGAIISLAAVVGRKIGIRPKRKDDWLEVPNLWGAIVGRPGVMKSPAFCSA